MSAQTAIDGMLQEIEVLNQAIDIVEGYQNSEDDDASVAYEWLHRLVNHLKQGVSVGRIYRNYPDLYAQGERD